MTSKENCPNLILLLFLALHASALWGLSDGLRFTHLSVDDGLSQNSIRSLMQDRRGFMWFGTEEGLNKFNGRSFEVFRNLEADSTSLSANDIRSILEDQKGEIWVGTTDGLNRLDPARGTFTRIDLPKRGDHSSRRNFIYSMFEDKDANIWMGTRDGFYHFNTRDSVFSLVTALGSHQLGQVHCFYEDRQGLMWIGADNGLYRMNRSRQLIEYYNFELGPTIPTAVSSILEDQHGTLWVGTFHGLFRSDTISKASLPNRHFRRVQPTLPQLTGNQEMVRCMLLDHDNLWVGTFDGLLILNIEDGSFRSFQHHQTLPGTLSANFIRSICRDSRGDIWMGTVMGGINVYHRDYSVFESELSDWAYAKMKGRIIHSFAEDAKGNVWVSTRDGGVSYLNLHAKTVVNYFHQPGVSNGLAVNEVRDLLIDDQGRIWMATYFGGVHRLDPKTGQFTVYRVDPDDPLSVNAENQNVIFQDSRGEIWIATHGGGLDRYVPESDGFAHYVHDPEDTSSLSSNIIVNLYEDSRQNLWIGTRHSGLNKMNLRTEEITRYRYDKHMAKSISSDAITAIHQDTYGALWIGTEDAGLNRWNEVQQGFEHFRIQDGLPSDAIHGIQEDEKGMLWLSTNKGLSHFDYEKRTFINYDQTDGLPSNQFSRLACTKTSDRSLMFGSINGFTIFRPEHILKNNYVPPVYITDFKLFNQEVPIGGKRSPLQKDISETTEITLRNDQSVFSLEFVALNYLFGSKNQFAYKLEGLDENWNYIGTRNSVDFTTLPHGDYVFRVKAANNSNVWNEVGASIKITVLPPWYKTWWAYLIYATSLIGLLLLYRYNTLVRLRERNKLHLAQTEKEQITELNNAKLQFFTNISHDLRSPLTLILGPLENLFQLAKGQPKMLKLLSYIRNNAEYLLRLINELLEFRKAEVGVTTLHTARRDLIPLLREIEQAFQEKAAANFVDFQLSLHEKEVVGQFDEDLIRKALYNLLSNAFEHTAKDGTGKIILGVSCRECEDNRTCHISVSDNGIGIPQDRIERIFDPFFQIDRGDVDKKKGFGIGLALTKRLIAMHNGQIQVESNYGEGSVFLIEIPVVEDVDQHSELIEQTSIIDFSMTSTNTLDQMDAVIKEDLSSLPGYRKPVVLVVEDNEEMQSYLFDCLSSNYTVLQALNGLEGFDLAISDHPDLVISDIMMPGMDGIGFCHKMKQDIHTSHIPLIFLSARSSMETRIKGIMTGADSYLTKPFSYNHLHAVIENLLMNRKQLWKSYKYHGRLPKRREQTLGPLDRRFLRQLEEVAEKHIKDTEFSVEQFAREMTMSRSYFHRKLKALTGLSASEFIKETRLKNAIRFLEENQLTISEIAYEVGFSSPNYFGRCFRNKYGMSPTEYKDDGLAVM